MTKPSQSPSRDTLPAVNSPVDTLEIRWYSVAFDAREQAIDRQEPVLGRNPGRALATFLYQTKLSRRTLGIDYVINGISLTRRLNRACKRSAFDVPGHLWNMLPLYWRWRAADVRRFALEVRRLLGEQLATEELTSVTNTYKFPEAYVQEHFYGVVQVYGCAHCGDRMCGWWGMEITDQPQRGRVRWSSPDLRDFHFDRQQYRQAFAPTLALLEHHTHERSRTDTSVYQMWRARRAKRAEKS